MAAVSWNIEVSTGALNGEVFLKCYKRLSASLQLYNIHNTKYMFTVI